MNDKQNRKKKRKQRQRLFNQGLRNNPNIEPNEYYASDKHKHLRYIDAGDVKIDGITYNTIKKLYQESLDSIDDYKGYLKGCEEALIEFLIAHGYNTPNINLNALVGDLNHLKIIIPNKEYIGYSLDGIYVTGYGYDYIMVKGEQPDDFDKGYWYIENDEWKLDQDKMNELWGGVI